jgi:hypothetical protein
VNPLFHETGFIYLILASSYSQIIFPFGEWANHANQRFAENNAHRQDVTDTKFCISREFLFCKISDPDKYKPKNNKGDKKEMYQQD